MTPEQDETLDDLLCRWHQWQLGATVGRGHASRALVVGDHVTSRQYDDQNGALDDAIENQIMRDVDFNVRELIEPWRSAIYMQARALTHGVMVFQSPRLPQDRVEREAVIAKARELLTARLISAGVMD